MPSFVEVPRESLKGRDEKELVMVERVKLKGMRKREKKMIAMIAKLQTTIKETQGTTEKAIAAVSAWNKATVSVPHGHISAAPPQQRKNDSDDSSGSDKDSSPAPPPATSSDSSSSKATDAKSSQSPHTHGRKVSQESDSSSSVHLAPRSHKRKARRSPPEAAITHDDDEARIVDLLTSPPPKKKVKKVAPIDTPRDLYDNGDSRNLTARYKSGHVSGKKKDNRTSRNADKNNAQKPKSSTKPSIKERQETSKPNAIATDVDTDKLYPTVVPQKQKQQGKGSKVDAIRNRRNYGKNQVPKMHEKAVSSGVVLSWQFVPPSGIKFNQKVCTTKLNSLIESVAPEGTTPQQLYGDTNNPNRRFMDVYKMLVSFIATEEIGDVQTDGDTYLSGTYNLDYDDRTLAQYIRDVPEPLCSAINCVNKLMFFTELEEEDRFAVVMQALTDIAEKFPCYKPDKEEL